MTAGQPFSDVYTQLVDLFDEAEYLPSAVALEAVADQGHAVARDRNDARGWALLALLRAVLEAREADDAGSIRTGHFDRHQGCDERLEDCARQHAARRVVRRYDMHAAPCGRRIVGRPVAAFGPLYRVACTGRRRCLGACDDPLFTRV
jgi:hypothetical protein